ncbi:tyrosine-type recombinase/integrase [Sulfurimonas sp.]|uniref:tyrosine-type recombinase/integrase n=1 Tax=Sulfurimonas sp. TaxID=2022749 RepID=UPI003562DF02
MEAQKQVIYDNYLQHTHIKGLAKLTIDLYTQEAKSFIEFVDDLESIGTPTVMEYLKKYSHMSSSTKNQHCSSLRAFMRHLSKNVYPDMNQINIPYIKGGRKLPNILEQDEFMRRIDVVKKQSAMSDDWIPKRDYALALLLYATGMRVSEVLSFNRSDINENNWVRIDSGKGSKDRYVPIAKVAIEAIDEYMRVCPFPFEKCFFVNYKGNQLTRISVYKLLKKSMGLNPHSIRHHFATHMIINGSDVSVVSELLGHSSLITTQIYTHIKKPQLAETANRCHPMASGVDYEL